MQEVFSIKKDFTSLFKLAVPLALTGVVQSAVYFFDTVFLAHVSQEVLAAGSLVSWLFGTFAVIILGTLSSINILIAHKYGAKDFEGIKLIVRDGLVIGVILTIPSFFLFWNMSPIFLIFGQSPTIVTLAEPFLHALSWGLFPDYIMIVILEFMMGLGHARAILIFSFISVSLNIFFSYALILGKFGFPSLEIAGAGWAITISYWISLFILVLYVWFNKYYFFYFSKIFCWEKPYYTKELLVVGLPMGAMYCIEVAFFFAMTLVIGTFGSQLLAANQIVLQYLGTLMAVIFAIAQAITVRMGHLLGAKNFIAAKRASYIGLLFSTVFMVFIAIFYCLTPEILIGIDFDISDPRNSEIIYYTKQFFIIAAVFQILEAIRIALFGALRGLKDTHFTLLTSIISFWIIALPLGYILARYLSLGGAGLWWGMVIGVLFGVLLLFARFFKKINYYQKMDKYAE